MFTPLHVKSDYSIGYGTASVDGLVLQAAALGYSALALTDLENLYGQVRFHHQCRAAGLRPLTGVELRPGFDGRRKVGSRSGRMVLLASDETGYRSLCRIISRRRSGRAGGEEGGRGKDPLPLIASEAQGLFALSDDPSVPERLLERDFPRDRLGLLLVRPGEPREEDLLLEAAQRLGVRVIADLDAVFLKESDHSLHLLQLAIQQGRKIFDPALKKESEPPTRWLRAPEEAAALFSDLPQAVAAGETLAEACRFSFGSGTRLGLTFPGTEESGPLLRKMCQDSAQRRKAEGWTWSSAYAARLDLELAQFEALGFSGFLLIIARILDYCRQEGIPVAARGSAVSSLALHLLGGSPVDPLAEGLLFERFLHSGKSNWPDIDLDLPWHRRDEVIDWVYRRFGRERVAMVAAHHTFRRRAALREGLKAWGAPPALIETLSRSLPPEDLEIEEVDFLDLAESAGGEFSQEQKETAAPSLGQALPLIQRLIGCPHHIAAHPGGMVIGEAPLEDSLPLERAPKGVVITQYDLAAVAALGLVKIDLLGNRTLSEIEETLRLVHSGDFPGLEAVPEEDVPALALIDRAETVGCSQLESPAMRSLLSRIPIRRQSDITAALALIRPGAAAGEAKSAYVRRARGEEPDDPFDPALADRLAGTHGMLLYEEDLMVLLSRLGGFSLEEADEMRAAIVAGGGNREAMAAMEKRFLDGAAVILGPGGAARARRAWEACARFAAYSFNKAHAASYGKLAYLSAYLKTHYRTEFACALLNHHQGFYPLRTVAGELNRRGVKLKPPQVNDSAYHSVLEKGGVRVGLDKMKVISIRSLAALLKEREANGPFQNLPHLLGRIRLPGRELAALVLSGGCDGLAPLSGEAYPFVHEAVLAQLKEGAAPEELGRLKVKPQARTPAERKRVKLFQNLVRVRNELRYLEMHLSGHPLHFLREEASRYGCVPLAEAADSETGSRLRLAATVAALRRVPTRQGAMQFITLEDETGLLEAAVLPPVYRRIGEQVTTPGPFLVEGRLVRHQDAVHLDVNAISPFHRREKPYH